VRKFRSAATQGQISAGEASNYSRFETEQRLDAGPVIDGVL